MSYILVSSSYHIEHAWTISLHTIHFPYESTGKKKRTPVNDVSYTIKMEKQQQIVCIK